MTEETLKSEDGPNAIDWAKLRDVLAPTSTMTDSDRGLSPEGKRALLRERAKKLARLPEQVTDDKLAVEVIEFQLAHERYGLESSYVREVYPLKELTLVPCTPAFVLGIVNIRGQILSVIDLKRFFGLPERGLTDLNRVIVLHEHGMEFGILADMIIGSRTIFAEDVQTDLPTVAGLPRQYLWGVTAEGMNVLHASQILRDQGIVVRDDMDG